MRAHCIHYSLLFSPLFRTFINMSLMTEKINSKKIIGDLANPASMIEWCMKMGLIGDKYECPSCGSDMLLRECGGKKKVHMWRCSKSDHDVKRSVRRGSWFERSTLTLQDILKITYFWTVKMESEFIVNDMDVSCETVVNWKNFCREVCMELCVSENVVLGGDGVIVEVDESKFGKRKYHRGRMVEGKWVFGGVERGSNKCFFAVVPERSSECLLNVIREWVKPGSTIISDCWKSYSCLSDEGYKHLTVNHSYNFVDPDTGAHTNSIEGTWSAIKRDLGANHCKNQFDLYLYEYMWRRKNRDNKNY